MTKAIIFDVDGTLIDSVDLHADAWRDAFAEFGHEIDLPAIRSQIGKGGDQLMPEFLDRDDLASFGEQLEKRRGEIMRETYIPRIVAFPQVRDLLSRLSEDGIRVVLASSAKQEELAVYKKIANIDDLIDKETTSDDAEKSKPHPDIFHAAMHQLGDVAARDVIVVGDSPYDAEAALKAGLRPVGVLSGGFAQADLEQAGCIAIFRDPADLLARYTGLIALFASEAAPVD